MCEPARQQILALGRLGWPLRRSLSVGIPPLAPGTYTVRYRVLSVDGHVVESERTTSTSRLRR
jgi:hypothetical protein